MFYSFNRDHKLLTSYFLELVLAKTNLFRKLEIAYLLKYVEVGDRCSDKTESQANIEHAGETNICLQSFHK